MISVSCSRKQDKVKSGAAPRTRKTAPQQVSATDDKSVSFSRKQDKVKSGAAPRPRKTALQQVSATDDKRVLLQEARQSEEWSCSTSKEDSTSAGKCY